MGLTKTKLNPTVRPCGFQKNGQSRAIKSTCLIARMKKLTTLNKKEKKNPALAVCITMYNENEKELKETISGVLQNYNAMYKDPSLKLRQNDLIVVCVADGYEKIPKSFIEYAT
jgi:Chitin synthase